jgi:DNA-directed RNA polymerase subunit K/omega
LGAPVLIDVDPGTMSAVDIAMQELEAGALPISIRRTLPDGTSQNIPLKSILKQES